jgi:hypothetical protein
MAKGICLALFAFLSFQMPSSSILSQSSTSSLPSTMPRHVVVNKDATSSECHVLLSSGESLSLSLLLVVIMAANKVLA